MASRGDQIIDALIARLSLPVDPEGLPEALEGLVVDRYPLRQGEGMRIRVYPFEEPVVPVSERTSRHLMLVKLELMAPIPDGLAGDQAVDPLYVWAIQRAVSDQRLGGLATQIREVKRAWGAREGEQAHGKLLLDLEVTYQTKADDPEART